MSTKNLDIFPSTIFAFLTYSRVSTLREIFNGILNNLVGKVFVDISWNHSEENYQGSL